MSRPVAPPLSRTRGRYSLTKALPNGEDKCNRNGPKATDILIASRGSQGMQVEDGGVQIVAAKVGENSIPRIEENDITVGTSTEFVATCESDGTGTVYLSAEFEEGVEYAEVQIECANLGLRCYEAWVTVPRAATDSRIEETIEPCGSHGVWNRHEVWVRWNRNHTKPAAAE